MSAWTQKVSPHLLTKPSHVKREQKIRPNRVDQTSLKQARTQNVSQLVFTKHLPCLREQKMNSNMWWSNSSHSIYDKNTSQHVMSKPIPCQRLHKMHLNTKCIYWQYRSNASEGNWCISTKLIKTIPCQRRQKCPQHVFAKRFQCQQGNKMPPKPFQGAHKMHLNICWANSPTSKPMGPQNLNTWWPTPC